jgi:hypothetical protein
MHPIEPPSATLAALRILAMAHAIAAVRALPARPMTTRSGRVQLPFLGSTAQRLAWTDVQEVDFSYAL